jgi:hypothetical protein
MKIVKPFALICLLALGAATAHAQPQPATTPQAPSATEGEIVYRVNLGRADDVKLLLSQGNSVNGTNAEGVPLLALASARVDAEGLNVVKALLEAGADVNAKDSAGQSALFYAARKGNREVVSLLLENRINYYAVDAQGNIARTIAFREGHTDIVALMDDFVKAETEKVAEQYRALSKALDEQYKAREDAERKAADAAASTALEQSRKATEAQVQKAQAEQKEQDDIQSLWSSDAFLQARFNLAFNSCAFQYWSYCRDAGQTSELKDSALAEAISSHQNKTANGKDELENTYKTSERYAGDIVKNGMRSIFNQLDAMPSNTYRFQQGVCRTADMVKRCNEVAKYPGTLTHEAPKRPQPTGPGPRRVYFKPGQQ